MPSSKTNPQWEFSSKKRVRYTGCEQLTAAKWKMDAYKGEMRDVIAANNRKAVDLLIGQTLEHQRQPCLKEQQKTTPGGCWSIANMVCWIIEQYKRFIILKELLPQYSMFKHRPILAEGWTAHRLHRQGCRSRSNACPAKRQSPFGDFYTTNTHIIKGKREQEYRNWREYSLQREYS